METTKLCEECRYARHDCYEYHGGSKQWFIDGCEKNEEPYYDEEEECITCKEYKRIEEW